jgi:hypothetical protein
MKIIEDTPNRLVLKEGALRTRSLGVLVIIVGLVMLGAGIKNHTQHNIILLDAVGLLLAVAGTLLLFISQSDMVVADKSTRQLSVSFKSLKNRRGVNQTNSFADIQSVQLFQHYQQVFNGGPNNFNHGPGMSFGGGFGVGMANQQTTLEQSLIVQLKNGTNITIAHEDKQTGLTLGLSANSLVNKGQKLAAVIGVPFDQQGAATPGQLLQMVEHKVVGQPESFVPPANNSPQSDQPVTPPGSPNQFTAPQPTPAEPAQETPPDQNNY